VTSHYREFISGRSPVPSENFAPRYKENGGNTPFLATDCPDFTDRERRRFKRKITPKAFASWQTKQRFRFVRAKKLRYLFFKVPCGAARQRTLLAPF
jgi:hypothetical protein